VSRRTFYQEFHDREDCFLAAFEDGLERISGVVLPAFEQGCARGWRMGLRGGLTALLRFLEDEPALGRLCIVDALSAGPEVLELRNQVLDALQDVVDRGRDQSRRGTSLPPLTAEGVVGAVFSVIHARLSKHGAAELTELVNPLMGMIVLPYLGPIAAARELMLVLPDVPRAPARSASNPYEGLNMRLTYRTLRVLEAIATRPGASNREVADGAGINDQGQMSRLLLRLQDLGLVRNNGQGQTKGGPNAWTLTPRGQELQHPPSD
jgi:AcrR family transcriptional regulator